MLHLPSKAEQGLTLLHAASHVDLYDSDVVKKINQFIDYYRFCDEKLRQVIIADIGLEYSQHLQAFAKVMAVYAIRENSLEYVIRGLIALAIEGIRDDFRFTVMALCLLYHSAIKLAADPIPLFKQAVVYGNKKVGDFMLQYLKDGSKDIREMGLKESYGPDGFDYIVDAI